MRLSRKVIGIVLISIGLLHLSSMWDIIDETFRRGFDVNVIDYYALLFPLGEFAIGVYLVIKSTLRSSSPAKNPANENTVKP